MNGHKFATLTLEKKEKIIKSAVRAANKEQKELVKSARASDRPAR